MPKATHQYRLYPFGEQAQMLEDWLHLCQQLYNSALEQRRIAHQMGFVVGYAQQQAELVALKRELPEYAAVPSHVLQNVLLRLDRAFENFFRRCRERRAGKKVKLGFPRFKSRARYNSLSCPDRYPYVRDGQLNFPKLGQVRLRLHRPLPDGAVIKSCTLSRKADGWYVAFSLETEATALPVHAGESVGIDVGLTSFAVLSTGEEEPPPKFFRKAEKKLRRAQRVLARRARGSRRRAKQKAKVARIHLHVARQRDDFLSKLAGKLAKRFRLIGVEDLNVRGMIRNPHLAKSIADASWYSFRQKLDHAAAKAGSRVVAVDARGTSQRCSQCSTVVPKALSERWHLCPHCGLSIGRDHNAARNIHKLAVLADGQEVTPRERKTSAFRYKRHVSPLVELGTVPEPGHAA